MRDCQRLTSGSAADTQAACAQRNALVNPFEVALLVASEDHRCRIAVALRLAADQLPPADSVTRCFYFGQPFPPAARALFSHPRRLQPLAFRYQRRAVAV